MEVVLYWDSHPCQVFHGIYVSMCGLFWDCVRFWDWYCGLYWLALVILTSIVSVAPYHGCLCLLAGSCDRLERTLGVNSPFFGHTPRRCCCWGIAPLLKNDDLSSGLVLGSSIIGLAGYWQQTWDYFIHLPNVWILSSDKSVVSIRLQAPASSSDLSSPYSSVSIVWFKASYVILVTHCYKQCVLRHVKDLTGSSSFFYGYHRSAAELISC